MVCCLVIVVWALRCLFCCVGVDFGLWCWSLRSVVLDWWFGVVDFARFVC